jgi:hypothetical protein
LAAVNPEDGFLMECISHGAGGRQIADDAEAGFFMGGLGIEARDRKMIETKLCELRLKLARPFIVVRLEYRLSLGVARRDDREGLRQAAVRQLGTETGMAVGRVHGLPN